MIKTYKGTENEIVYDREHGQYIVVYEGRNSVKLNLKDLKEFLAEVSDWFDKDQ